jgi:hypothetical protein
VPDPVSAPAISCTTAEVGQPNASPAVDHDFRVLEVPVQDGAVGGRPLFGEPGRERA